MDYLKQYFPQSFNKTSSVPDVSQSIHSWITVPNYIPNRTQLLRDMIVDNDIDIESRSSTGYTILSSVLLSENFHDVETIEMLLSLGANINSLSNGMSPISVAVLAKKPHFVDYLVNKADLSLCGLEQYTPLHLACIKGYTSVIEILVWNGSNIHHINIHGLAPVDQCKFGSEALMKTSRKRELVKDLIRITRSIPPYYFALPVDLYDIFLKYAVANVAEFPKMFDVLSKFMMKRSSIGNLVKDRRLDLGRFDEDF